MKVEKKTKTINNTRRGKTEIDKKRRPGNSLEGTARLAAVRPEGNNATLNKTKKRRFWPHFGKARHSEKRKKDRGNKG